MAGSVVRSSTTSGISAAKPRASKSGARAKRPKPAANELLLEHLFAELARIAEMSAVERQLREFGFRCIAGTDEVGRGCLAGPVVAACVVLDEESSLFGVNDSKLIATCDDRVGLCRAILSRAAAVTIGVMEPETIDRVNILQASKLAMAHAVHDLPLRPEVLLLDAVTLEMVDMPQIPLIEGDKRSISIAAASIVAKVYRDLLMESYHERYPVYDFIHNRGYATESHQAALKTYGPTPIHRKSFDGVDEPMLLFGSSEGHGGPAR